MIDTGRAGEIDLDVVADGLDEPWRPVDLLERPETKQYGEEAG